MSTPQLGSVPLTVGSLHEWQLTVTKSGAVWDLSAQVVYLWWKRPNGTVFKQTATSSSVGICTYDDVASQLDVTGGWNLSVEIVGFGRTVPIPFTVVVSP